MNIQYFSVPAILNQSVTSPASMSTAVNISRCAAYTHKTLSEEYQGKWISWTRDGKKPNPKKPNMKKKKHLKVLFFWGGGLLFLAIFHCKSPC